MLTTRHLIKDHRSDAKRRAVHMVGARSAVWTKSDAYSIMFDLHSCLKHFEFTLRTLTGFALVIVAY